MRGKSMLRCVIGLLCIAMSPVAAAQAPLAWPDPRDALEGPALVEALRGGGYTLYFRHAPRVRASAPPPADRPDCPGMLALSATGIAQSRAIGEALAALRIPIGESLASPMCRTMQTAQLIAGRATATETVRDENLGGAPFAPLARILATPPAAGTNRLVSGHVSAFNVLHGSPVLQEGEVAVYRGDGTRRVLVARVRAEDWKALASPANRPPRAERSSAADTLLGLRDEVLVDALRAGGYAIYFRHAATDTSQQDRPTFKATDCKAQRNLSEAGRAQAKAIGEAVAKLKLPLGEVIASPYCRTMETARLIAGRATPEEAVRGRSSTRGGVPDYSGLEKIVATPVNAGALRMIVGHGNGFRDIAGGPHLEEGEAAVVRAVAGGGWIVVARIRPEDWKALVASLADALAQGSTSGGKGGRRAGSLAALPFGP
jgi:broad specificity phosphatase PhoE